MELVDIKQYIEQYKQDSPFLFDTEVFQNESLSLFLAQSLAQTALEISDLKTSVDVGADIPDTEYYITGKLLLFGLDLGLRIDFSQPTDQMALSLELTMPEDWVFSISGINLFSIGSFSFFLSMQDASTVSGYMRGIMKSGSLGIPISIVLPVSKLNWTVIADFSSIALPSLSDLATLLGSDDLADYIPNGVNNAITSLEIKDLCLAFNPAQGSVDYVSLLITQSENSVWDFYENKFVLKDFFFNLIVKQPLVTSDRTVNLGLGGIFGLGSLDVPVYLERDGETGDWLLELASDSSILLPGPSDVLELISGESISLPEEIETLGDLELYSFAIGFNPAEKALRSISFEIGPEGDFQIPGIDQFKITDLIFSLELDKQTSNTSISLSGSISIADVLLEVSADYDSDAGWYYQANLADDSTIDLGNLIASVAQSVIDIPFSAPELSITDLFLEITVPSKAAGGSASFNFTSVAAWDFKIQNVPINTTATLELAYGPGDTGKSEFSGSVSAAVTLESLGIDVTLSYSFGGDEKLLSLVWEQDGRTFTGIYSMEGGEKYVAFQLTNTSIADIFNLLIKPLNEELGLNISIPSFLSSVFDAVELDEIRLNLDDKSIEVTVGLNQDVIPGLVTIDTITIISKKVSGRRKMYCNFTGTFIDAEYPEGNPLVWDVEQSPPATAPQSKILALRYLGIGQHVALADVSQIDSVDTAITYLRDAVTPPTDAKANPLTAGAKLVFKKDASWLLGVDFTLLNIVTLKAVFNDPDIYGLYIALDGKAAKSLAGLKFEILYRKVTEDIGVYSTELTLPDALRRLEFGAVSITLPVIGVDIYTNSNFKIDVGFPTSLKDFSRSGCAQLFPFIGYAGFYFAVLNGKTSSTVPVPKSGYFDPVLEFGFALSLGVGKTFSMGPLKAGIQVTLNGMLEGTLAWFHYTDDSTDDMYYRIKGQVGLYGEIYGSIDFVIIKASVRITVYAGISMVIEAYRKIPVKLEAEVSASVSVKVLFVRIHKSFKATVRLDFTIGSDSIAPWDVAQVTKNAAASTTTRIFAMRSAPAASLKAPTASKNRTLSAAALTANDTTREQINILLIPALSQAQQKDLDADSEAETTTLSCNTLFFIPNAVSTDARTQTEVTTKTDENEESDFDRLAGLFFDWLMDKLIGETGEVAGLDDLETLLTDLEKVEKGEASSFTIEGRTFDFSYVGLTEFFNDKNIELVVKKSDADSELSASFFPVVPELDYEILDDSGQTLKEINLSTQSPCDTAYEAAVDSYFDEIAMKY